MTCLSLTVAMLYRMWSRTVPWGTPHFDVLSFDLHVPTLTNNLAWTPSRMPCWCRTTPWLLLWICVRFFPFFYYCVFCLCERLFKKFEEISSGPIDFWGFSTHFCEFSYLQRVEFIRGWMVIISTIAPRLFLLLSQNFTFFYVIRDLVNSIL